LNPEQCRAVEHRGDPLLIVAGPGTGKTLTLTHRIVYLISRLHVDSGSILAVTFTNKASQEMRQRLEALLDGSTPLPLVATFHALCLQMLKQIDNGQDHTLVDDIDRGELMSKALRLAQKEGHKIVSKPQKVFDRISSAKQRLLSPDELLTTTGPYEDLAAVAAVYRSYQRLLSTQKLYDYEDLVFRVVRLLETDSNLCRQYQQRFQHVLVDEYQDLNQGQYRLIRAISPLGRNLFAIGDPDQSIYGFRGSDVQYFNQFIGDYPNAGIVHLKKNYRSTQTILNASRQVIIAGNDILKTDSRIYSGIEGIKTIGIFETDSEKAEAVAVGKSIEQMIGGVGFYSLDFGKVDGFEDRAPFGFSDFAVLYRTGAQGERMGEILEKAGIPCQTTHKKYLHQNKGRSIIFSYLKVIEGVGSYLDLERIAGYPLLKVKKAVLETFIDWGVQQGLTLQEALVEIERFLIPGVKSQDQRKLLEYAGRLQSLRAEIRSLPVQEKIDLIYKNLNPRYFEKHHDYAEQRNEIMNLAGDCGKDTVDFLVKMALQTDTDLYDSKAEKVALLTMHAAKGLEFPVVFITGCEKDLIPLRPPQAAVQNIEEERRLFYVAMTRAKDILYLTYAKKRHVYGKLETRTPSPFVRYIEKRLKKYESSEKIRSKPVAKGPKQLKLF
jgi:superfamily I DNA/RNA helicase